MSNIPDSAGAPSSVLSGLRVNPYRTRPAAGHFRYSLLNSAVPSQAFADMEQARHCENNPILKAAKKERQVNF